MSAWTRRQLRQGRGKDCSTSSSYPMMEGPCAESEEKHEPASDADAAVVDSLKALDPNRPIREADIAISEHGASSAASKCLRQSQSKSRR